jgi:hypothetical protein
MQYHDVIMMKIYIVITAHWELRKGSSTPSRNCDVCARVSAAIILPCYLWIL